MGLNYPTQVPIPLIGTKDSANTRTAVTLTSSYEAEAADKATKTFDVGGFSRVEFAINYTMGATESSNSIEIKLEYTPDGTNFYRLVNDSTSAGTSTLTVREFTYVGVNAAAAPITFGVDIAYKDAMRISIKETGVASNAGTVFAEACLSGR